MNIAIADEFQCDREVPRTGKLRLSDGQDVITIAKSLFLEVAQEISHSNPL
jgi:hypothetical protein